MLIDVAEFPLVQPSGTETDPASGGVHLPFVNCVRVNEEAAATRPAMRKLRNILVVEGGGEGGVTAECCRRLLLSSSYPTPVHLISVDGV